MNRLLFILKFLNHILWAKGRHGLHSPFVYDLVENVIQPDDGPTDEDKIELLRSELLKVNDLIELRDLGAGSTMNSLKKRQINSIAKNSLKSPKLARLLFRISNRFKPEFLLELGTSFGITSMYLSEGTSTKKFITIEGDPMVAKIAKDNFLKLNYKNIELVEGNFDELMSSTLKKFPRIDLAFVDGNHRKIPTLSYFEQLLKSVDKKTILIFDDIHWSKEMEEAWEIIKRNEGVTITIDLFFIGLVFFHENQAKENFRIRFLP